MPNKQIPETICMIPWVAMEVNSLGNYRPCCIMSDFVTDDFGQNLSATTHSLSDAFSSKWMQKLRQRFLAGDKPSACNACWSEEEAGKTSKRLNTKSRLGYLQGIAEPDYSNTSPDDIYYIDLKLGNICNLQCRVCGSWSSSKIASEELSLIPISKRKDNSANEYRIKGKWPREASKFWDDLRSLLPGIKYFEITGGEPFLIKQQFELLQFAVDEGYAGGISIHYNTNGTQYPENAAEIWKHFRHVEIAFSIDNITERFEYERKNAVWSEVVANIARFNDLKAALNANREQGDENITTQICLTVNAQNVFYLPELCEWGLTQKFNHFYFNLLHYPESMSISTMTTNAKSLVIDKLENADFDRSHRSEINNLIRFMQNGKSLDGKDFADKMFAYDTVRNEDFTLLYPEIAEAMDYRKWIKPDNFCMAPWVHTYISPQSERRMCCNSREPAQSFKQYIDTEASDGKYNPLSLSDHWNSDHMRDVRQRMMKGEVMPECENCNSAPGGNYRDYFWHLFGKTYNHAMDQTSSDGRHNGLPVSWDYRISNLCNFKCRMCGDMLSSSWEAEMKKHNMTNLQDPKNFWMQPEIRKNISTFQKDVVYDELKNAVSAHSVEEIYWVGGEPLMMEEHWEIMTQLIDNGDIKNVYVRYNTNLSQLEFKKTHLYNDILPKTQNWEICASIDGVGEIGEYIRTGLKWESWLQNFKDGLKIQTRANQMRLDLTLTLPGLIDLKKMFDLSKELNTQVLTKAVLAYSPDVFMSPQILPRDILNAIIDDHLAYMEPIADWKQKSIIDQLKNLRDEAKTAEEQWPATFADGVAKAKGACERLERIRDHSITMADIMALRDDTNDWWQSIDAISEKEYNERNGDRG